MSAVFRDELPALLERRIDLSAFLPPDLPPVQPAAHQPRAELEALHRAPLLGLKELVKTEGSVTTRTAVTGPVFGTFAASLRSITSCHRRQREDGSEEPDRDSKES